MWNRANRIKRNLVQWTWVCIATFESCRSAQNGSVRSKSRHRDRILFSFYIFYSAYSTKSVLDTRETIYLSAVYMYVCYIYVHINIMYIYSTQYLYNVTHTNASFSNGLHRTGEAQDCSTVALWHARLCFRVQISRVPAQYLVNPPRPRLW